MANNKSVKERIRELEEKYADSIREAQSQPGLKEMEIVYGDRPRRKQRAAVPTRERGD